MAESVSLVVITGSVTAVCHVTSGLVQFTVSHSGK